MTADSSQVWSMLDLGAGGQIEPPIDLRSVQPSRRPSSALPTGLAHGLIEQTWRHRGGQGRRFRPRNGEGDGMCSPRHPCGRAYSNRIASALRCISSSSPKVVTREGSGQVTSSVWLRRVHGPSGLIHSALLQSKPRSFLICAPARLPSSRAMLPCIGSGPAVATKSR